HLHVIVGVDLRLAARERHDAAFGAAHAAEKESPKADDEQQGNDPADDIGKPAVGDFAGVLDAVLLELLGELRVRDPDGGEGFRLLTADQFEEATNAILGKRDLLDFSFADQGLEVAVGDRLAARELEEERLRERQQQQKAENV